METVMDRNILADLQAWRTREPVTRRAEFGQPSQLLKLSLSLLAHVCCLLDEREHCQFGCACKRMRKVSQLSHSWGSLMIGSAHLPGCRCDDPLRQVMCLQTRQSSDWHDSFSDAQQRRCLFCRSVLRFWDGLRSARPLHLCVQWRNKEDWVRLPKVDRLRTLTLRQLPDERVSWLSQMPMLTELILNKDKCGSIFGFMFRERQQVAASKLMASLASVRVSQLRVLRVPDVYFADGEVEALVHSGLPLTDLSLTCSRRAVQHLPKLELYSLCIRYPPQRVDLVPAGLRLEARLSSKQTDSKDEPLVLPTLATMSLHKLTLLGRSPPEQHPAKIVFPHLLELRADASVVRAVDAPKLTQLDTEGICPEDLCTFPALTALSLRDFIARDSNWWSLFYERRFKKLHVCLDSRSIVHLAELPGLEEVAVRSPVGDFAFVASGIEHLGRKHIRVQWISFQNDEGLNEAALLRLAPHLKALRHLTLGEWRSVSRQFLFKHFGRLDIHLIHENCESSDLSLTEYMCPLEAKRTFWEASGLGEQYKES